MRDRNTLCFTLLGVRRRWGYILFFLWLVLLFRGLDVFFLFFLGSYLGGFFFGGFLM